MEGIKNLPSMVKQGYYMVKLDIKKVSLQYVESHINHSFESLTDSVSMKLLVPKEKKKSVIKEIRNFLKLDYCSPRKRAGLKGKLIVLKDAVIPFRLYTRSTNKFHSQCLTLINGDWDQSFPIPQDHFLSRNVSQCMDSNTSSSSLLPDVLLYNIICKKFYQQTVYYMFEWGNGPYISIEFNERGGPISVGTKSRKQQFLSSKVEINGNFAQHKSLINNNRLAFLKEKFKK
ncbi:hypothetical protein ACTFIR_003815 [Dictyostelium discoideum]